MKSVLVTGGAGGIGSSISKTFIEHGYFVYILDTDTEKSAALVAEHGANHCCAVNLDVTDPKSIQAYCSSLGDEFALNHIITLAGRALEGEWLPFQEQTLDTAERSVKLNLLGHINVIHSFLPFLLKSEGERSIVMVSSINAVENFGLPVYSAAKSGLYGFMNGIVGELGKAGVRINTISPGTVVTPATETEPKDFDKLLEGAALDRFATAEDVANAVFSVCTVFRSMTGQNLIIDAGQIITHSY